MSNDTRQQVVNALERFANRLDQIELDLEAAIRPKQPIENQEAAVETAR